MFPTPPERRMRPRLIPALLLGYGIAFGSPAAAQPVVVPQLGLDTAGFDRSVRPQDDFNRFVNGRWADRVEIPADRPAWGSFYELDERTQAALKAVAEEAAAARARGGERQKVGDFYASY